MKMRNLMAGMIAAGLANCAAGAALADAIQIGVSTNPNSYGVAEIKVDGPSADGVYTEVRTIARRLLRRTGPSSRLASQTRQRLCFANAAASTSVQRQSCIAC
jgi:hypothetical protein